MIQIGSVLIHCMPLHSRSAINLGGTAMNKTISTLTLSILSAAALNSAAHAADDGWSGKGEGGITVVSGNSDSQIITAGLEVGKKVNQWEHSAKVSVLRSESSDVDTADSLLVGWVSKYLINDRSFLFGDLRYLDDDFDSFDSILTYAAGYGYKVLLEEAHTWDVSIGAGYRDTEYAEDRVSPEELEAAGLERDISAATVILGSDYMIKLSETTTFENDTRAEITSDNSYIQNVAGLSVAMSDNLALKLKYDVRHNTDPAPGSTSTDKITSVNVVYGF